MRGILSLLGPILLIVLAVWLEPEVRGAAAANAGLVKFGPQALLVGGLFLAARFHRTRDFFGLLALAVAHAALITGLAGEDGFAAVAILLPFDLALFALLSERGIFTPSGAWRFIVIALEVAALAHLARFPSVEVSEALRRQLFPDAHTPLLIFLPQLGIVAANVAAVVLLAKHLARPSPDTGAFTGALVAAVLALHRGSVIGRGGEAPDLGVVGLYTGAAGLMLILAVVEASYRMAFLDELTGLPGRRALGERLRQLGGAYAVAMVDVDHFKKFNDTYGHDIGDDCLRMVAGRLAQVGGGGEAFRYGGEEFAVVFPGRSVDDALPTLEALRAAIEAAPFRPRKKDDGFGWNPFSAVTGGKGKIVNVTVSIGVAGPVEGSRDPWAAIKAADEGLYRAKKGGRNRVAK